VAQMCRVCCSSLKATLVQAHNTPVGLLTHSALQGLFFLCGSCPSTLSLSQEIHVEKDYRDYDNEMVFINGTNN